MTNTPHFMILLIIITVVDCCVSFVLGELILTILPSHGIFLCSEVQ